MTSKCRRDLIPKKRKSNYFFLFADDFYIFASAALAKKEWSCSKWRIGFYESVQLLSRERFRSALSKVEHGFAQFFSWLNALFDEPMADIGCATHRADFDGLFFAKPVGRHP
jgi:hypothetical protein